MNLIFCKNQYETKQKIERPLTLGAKGCYMGMFDNLDQTNTVEVEEEGLYGGGYVKETGVYDFIVKMAHGGQSEKGAYFIKMDLETEGGQKLSVTEYITSGTEKGIRPYYIDKEGKQKALPGYAKMNAVDVVLTGNAGQYPVTETKTIPLYNKEADEIIPTKAEVITGWVGKPITALIRCVREFKRVQNSTTKKWENTTETTEFAEVVHFVDAVTGQTRSEKMSGKEAGVKVQFENKYNSDFVYDKTKGKGGKPKAKGEASAPEAPEASPFGATKE